MKIQIFKIIKTSYRYGDENGITEILFSTKELMDKYFYILYEDYKNNTHLYEVSTPLTELDSITCSQFEFKDGTKWEYEVSKEISVLTIHDSLENLK